MTEDTQADVYGAMNLFEDAFRHKGAKAVTGLIECWLNEDDPDRPDWLEPLAQGVIDAVEHAAAIKTGRSTITIVHDGALVRFDWFSEDGPSPTFDKAVLRAVRNALRPPNGG